jgi:hypothetical protein
MPSFGRARGFRMLHCSGLDSVMFGKLARQICSQNGWLLLFAECLSRCLAYFARYLVIPSLTGR